MFNDSNYTITDLVKEAFELKGFETSIDSSKSSDYLTLKADDSEFFIRFSNHSAIASRSKCANADFEMIQLFAGELIAIDIEEDEEIEFNTKQERNAFATNQVVREIEDSTAFYNFCRFTKFEFESE